MPGNFSGRVWGLKMFRGIYRTGLTWKDQNQCRKAEINYMHVPSNAFYFLFSDISVQSDPHTLICQFGTLLPGHYD